MGAFFSYIVLGLSLSAPIGPINAAQLDKGIKHGFGSAWLVGIGAMIADICFMFLIYFGLAQFINIPIVKVFLWLFGGFILLYTGIDSIIHAGKEIQETQPSTSYKKSFLTGFLMALSNPLNIIFWLGIYGSILANTMAQYSMGTLLFYSSGIFVGILIWDAVMAYVASTVGKWDNQRLLKTISLIAGVVLVGFGIYFTSQAAQIIL
ncbi:LysE family translocator [Pontibacillus litoralis]|uniref:Amino acid transporter n=1 Tax=Pontibacillus litoralis JSM 072002 TaxID=1385512 RepID=A0A0A5G6U8_9BACI|nr:LysE family translocator [Pontibacillus litoralis]KGX86830.1 amino acid transporter [Pontibacillus litoralis JSM 072002]